MLYDDNNQDNQLLYQYIKEIRERNKWPISDKINSRLPQNIQNVKRYQVENIVYELLSKVRKIHIGNIVELNTERKFGFIEDQTNSNAHIYFKFKDFIGKKEDLAKGLNVKFLATSENNKLKAELIKINK